MTASKKRVTKACDPCRLRKAKCDAELPYCSGCAANPKACTYSNTSKRRGLPSGYIHDLERKVLLFQTLLTYLMSNDEGSLESAVKDALTSKRDHMLASISDLLLKWDASRISYLVDKMVVETNKEVDPMKQVSQGLKPSIAMELHAGGDAPISVAFNRKTFTSPIPPSNVLIHVPIQTPSASISSDSLSLIKNQRRKSSFTSENVSVIRKPSDSYPYSGGNTLTNQLVASQTPNYTVSNTGILDINSPSFPIKNDIFLLISQPFYTASAEALAAPGPSTEPVVLQFHGLSSLISGFTVKAITEYSEKERSMRVGRAVNPFKVDSIFNLSSSAMKAAFGSSQEFPAHLRAFPPNTKELLDNYFHIYHPWLPMLNRLALSRRSKDVQLKGLPVANDPNSVALIWAVIGLGKIGTTNSTKEDLSAVEFAQNATLALEYSQDCTIETVQTILVLGLLFYTTGNWDYLWVLILSASRMAIDVRLMHRADKNGSVGRRNTVSGLYSNTGNEEDVTESTRGNDTNSFNNINRERTWACVYILNTMLSSRLGRAPHIRAKDWEVPQVSVDGWEEWEPWTSYHAPDDIKMASGRFLLTFNQLLKVVAVWNQALTCTIDITGRTLKDDQNEYGLMKLLIKRKNDLANPKEDWDQDAIPDYKNSNTCTLAYFQRTLNYWNSKLPDYCTLLYYLDMDKVPPLVAFLHLACANVWCVLGVRLSELTTSGSSTDRDHIISVRDLKYTKAIQMIGKIVNAESIKYLHKYPLVDYSLVMSLGFPKMMDFDGGSLAVREHVKLVSGVLDQAAQMSASFAISREVYRIMLETKEIVVPGTVNAKRAAEPDSDTSSSDTKRRKDYLANQPLKSLYILDKSPKKLSSLLLDNGKRVKSMIDNVFYRNLGVPTKQQVQLGHQAQQLGQSGQLGASNGQHLPGTVDLHQERYGGM